MREPISPVYTTENECQDCYKCVRHCPVKAIRIIGGKASVIPEACVACGECVKVCPAHAKKIRSDLARLRELLAGSHKVYASIAPSYVGYFKGVSIRQIAATLQKVGFAGVSETAHGAEAVSANVAKLLTETKPPLLISSACPAAVDMVRMYLPSYAHFISQVPSPIRAHCRLIKEAYGEDAKIVFFGPCAAKKNEADAYPDELALAIIFPMLAEFLNAEGLSFNDEAELALGPAEEGRFYSIEGGMNDTLRHGSTQVRYLSVSGLDNLRRILRCNHLDTLATQSNSSQRTIFLEVLACPGGCVNGPAMPDEGGSLDTIFKTDAEAPLASSAGRDLQCGTSAYSAEAIIASEPDESAVLGALARIGKFVKTDELNCGACGYGTCREFAKALLVGKAEEAMCHTYLKKNFQRTSNALIKYIPAGVVIVDAKGQIMECNEKFATIAGATVEFEALGNLNNLSINDFMPDFADLFTSAIEHDSEIVKYRQPWKGRVITLSVFPIARGENAGAVVQDVTQNEGQREEIAAKAREVIWKNVYTVQEVARLFGEHIAETEIMLNEIAGAYESKTEGKRLRQTPPQDYLNG